MHDRLLDLLTENARLSDAELAQRLEIPESEVRSLIRDAEQRGVILGYRLILGDRGSDNGEVVSVVEVGLSPERDRGFDRIAERIARFSEVISCTLMSGSYDLLVQVRGRSLQQVAAFVSERLATIDGVRSTRTHFVLKRYKEDGVLLFKDESVERLPVSP
jgi:DNA-binding Lrp family transcriptional regulator